MTLGAALSKTLASFSSTRHDDMLFEIDAKNL